MKKLSPLLAVFLLLFFTTGCTSVKRYKSAIWKEQDNSLVDMELFGARLTQPGSEVSDRNLWDLSASAQTQLIQILDKRYPNNAQYISALSKQYLSDGTLSPMDLTKKDLRMVFTIKRQRDFSALNQASSRFSPADRIEYLKFSLELPSRYKLRFTHWNRYTTEYGEIEIADVSFSTSLDLDADGTIELTDAGGKASFSRNEQQEVRSRYLKLNGSISDQVISIEEEGTREIDLTGNVTVDVSMEFDGFPERIAIPLFLGEDQGGNSPAEVTSLRFVDVLVPRLDEAPDTLFAMLNLEYVYRHVQSGWKTFAEWDDRVEYYSGSIKKQVTLFLKEDYLPVFYCIGIDHPDRAHVKIRKETGKEYLLQFKDYTDASRVMEWLERLAGKNSGEPLHIGNASLWFNGKSLTPDQITGNAMKVMPVY